MDKIRCFIATELPLELKLKIDTYIDSLRNISPQIKWIKAKNLHITLKFLGEIPYELIEKIHNELSDVSTIVNPFEMSVRGTGFFPNQNKPRVIWLGLQNDSKNSIFKLHEWIDKKLQALGFEREKRRFSPHLTLGRIKFPDNIQKLSEFINKNEFKSEFFKVDQIILMRSELKPTGAEYSQIKNYMLGD